MIPGQVGNLWPVNFVEYGMQNFELVYFVEFLFHL